MNLSLSLMVWNTGHLLARTLETLQRQDFEGDWELHIIDDCSEDDIPLIVEQHGQGLPIKYHRLDHCFGMRGNTVSLNHALSVSTGDVVMWSTPEVMLPPGALRAMYGTLVSRKNERLFVTIPSHGLTSDVQLRIDEVDWRSNVHAIKSLLAGTRPDDFDSKWFYRNFYAEGRVDLPHKKSYGNNQTVGVLRESWMDTVGPFPLFLDYGSDDPWIAGIRKSKGYETVTLWDHEAYHQWHAPIGYWIAQGKAPNWNKHGHTMCNLLRDPVVPAGGTCVIWDNGSHEQMSQEEIREALLIQEIVHVTGFRRRR